MIGKPFITSVSTFMIAALWGASASFLLSKGAHADGPDVKFTADLDRAEISVDEYVTLKLTVQSENGQVGEPHYSAPAFDLLNQYNAVQSESFYDESTGRIGMRNSFEVNKVLRPKKEGTFKISGISIDVGGQTYRAPDLTVVVSSGGGGTPPPKGYGGAGVGLRGAGKRSNLPSVFARAEIDKNKVYKGEQVVVSYYVYERVRAFNIEITKFPALNGFLRAELEMPYINRKLDMEQVVLDGVAYARGLLVRYAAYPLQEGKLDIDPIELKFNYYNDSEASDSDDPFAPFAGFFKQALPGNSKSSVLQVDVQPLPTQGRPNSFSGGVGDFDVVSAVDKVEVPANQAVTLTVKVEGRGNVEAIAEPKAKWPSNVELYDTKGAVKSGKGVGQKTFEFLLIPRQPGPLELPSLEFTYFDPKKSEYVTKKTDPIKINVLDPAPGSAPYVPKATSPADAASAGQTAKISNEPRGLKASSDSGGTAFSGLPMWRWVYWIALAAIGFFIFLVARDQFSNFRKSASEKQAARAKQEAKSWTRLKAIAAKIPEGTSWNEVLTFYDSVAAQVFDAIDRVYSVGSRSYSREELKRMLVDDRGLADAVWQRASRVLEFAELVRFAKSAGAFSESTIRSEASKWVQEAESVSRLIERPERPGTSGPAKLF
jgi:hypothetical protein